MIARKTIIKDYLMKFKCGEVDAIKGIVEEWMLNKNKEPVVRALETTPIPDEKVGG